MRRRPAFIKRRVRVVIHVVVYESLINRFFGLDLITSHRIYFFFYV